jgi:hypothetical protein
LLPSQELLSFTLYDFVRLIYVVLVLGRFSSGCGSPTLDPGFMRESANFEHYIVQLICMTEPLIEFSEGEERVDYMWHVRRLFQASKACLDRVSSDIFSLGTTEPELAFMEIFPSIIGRCVDLSVTKYGCCTENGGMNMSFSEWPMSSVDPSLVMIGGNKN